MHQHELQTSVHCDPGTHLLSTVDSEVDSLPILFIVAIILEKKVEEFSLPTFLYLRKINYLLQVQVDSLLKCMLEYRFFRKSIDYIPPSNS